jgi:lipooligosaccharide transport system permease protein
MKAIISEKIPFTKGVLDVWYRNFFYFKKTFLVSLFWILVEPVFYLGAIGYGLGAYVNNIEGKPFVEFFFPALLCTTGMFISFFESTYTHYTKLTHQKIYSTMMLSPLSADEIVFGEILWSASKGWLSSAGVALVGALLGLVDSWTILPALIVFFITSFLFSAFGMLMTSVARNYDSFIYSISGFLIPMSLLSGTYFPLDHVPTTLKVIFYIFPLTHSVDLVRGLLLHQFSWWMILNFLFLLVVGYSLVVWSIRRIRIKLYY